MRRGLALLLLAIPLASQTVINGSRQIKGVWDASAAASTKPFKTGTTLPAACVTGEAFLNTSAPEGQNVYVCTAANVWTQQGGGASMAAQLGDFAVVRTSSTVLTIGSNCSAARPCNVRTGGVVRSFNSPATVTVSSGTGTAYVYVDSSGTLTVGQNLGLACAGCTAVSGIAAFPANSVPLFTWPATSGTWDATGGSDQRAFLSDRAVAAGSGITASEAGGSTVVAVDNATVPRYSAGIGLPGTCTVGQQFIKTDAPADQRVYFCTAANTWTQPSSSGLPVNLNTTAPLTGGGSLAQDRTLNCPTCVTSTSGLGGNSIVKGGGGQALTASGASIDNSHNISTPGNITTGVGTGTTGKLSLSGATSGTVDVTVGSVAGTWTLKLPTSAGTNGQVMRTDGTGAMSFATLAASDLSNGVTGSGAVVLATAPTLTGPIVQSYTVATLPATAANKVAIVTDGNAAADCTVGGGSNRVLCHYTGSAWTALGDGNTGSAPGFNAITTGTNVSATMTVGTGGSLTYSGSGTVNASRFKGNATIAVADGGTGATGLTGVLKGNGTSAFTAAIAGTDYVSPSSSETLTNKTINAEGAGNSIILPITWWIDAAGCQNAAAMLMWDTPTSNPAVAACVTGTNTQKGVADFADGSNLSMQRTVVLPSDWTGAIDVKLKWFTAATTGSVVWQVATACVADGETDDPSFNAASTVADAAKGVANQTNDATITGVTATGCAAGELLHLKVFRDAAHASDDLAATARLIGIEVKIRRAM